MISQKLKDSLKQQNKALHKVAWDAGLTPNQLYKITSGIDRPSPDDPRILKLAIYLGLTIEECFETT